MTFPKLLPALLISAALSACGVQVAPSESPETNGDNSAIEPETGAALEEIELTPNTPDLINGVPVAPEPVAPQPVAPQPDSTQSGGGTDGNAAAGNTDGEGTSNGTDTSGATDGEGATDGTDTSATTGGEGSTDGTDTSGTTSGEGITDGTDTSGTTSGEGITDGTDTSSTTSGEGITDGTDTSGTTGGEASTDSTDTSGTSDGEGTTDGTDTSATTGGEGTTDGTDTSGTTGGEGSTDGTDTSGTTGGEGSTDGTDTSGTTGGEGITDGTDTSGTTGGEGSTDGTDTSGTTGGEGSTDGTDTSGTTGGEGSTDGTDTSATTGGEGSTDGTDTSGTTGGEGSTDGTDNSGTTGGEGITDGTDNSGTTSGEGITDGADTSGTSDGEGTTDGTDTSATTGGEGTTDGTDTSGTTGGEGSTDGTDTSGTTGGEGSTDGTDTSGTTGGEGSTDGTDTSGTTGGEGSTDGTDTSATTGGEGTTDGTDTSGTTGGEGSTDGTDTSGTTGGEGSTDGTDTSGTTGGEGSTDGTDTSGTTDGEGSTDGTDTSGTTGGEGSTDGTDTSGTTGGEGSTDGTDTSGTTDGEGSTDGTDTSGTTGGEEPPANNPPTIEGTPASEVAGGSAYEFAPVATDADDDELLFNVTGQPAWADFDITTGALSGSPTNNDAGIYDDIVISVTDGEDSNALAAFSIAVTYTNSAPSITGTPELTVAGGNEYLFAPVATDPDGQDVTFTIEGLPNWMVFNESTGELSGSATNDVSGTYDNIIISATDGELSTALPAFSIEVTYTNTAPAISGVPATSLAPGQQYSFIPAVEDIDAHNTFTFTAVNLPSWATLDTNTGEISGTPAEAALFDDIQLTVDDGEATDSLSFFIRVQPAQEFAQAGGIASQGSQYGNYAPGQAIDGSLDTYNHTGCEADNNWWQVELPHEITVEKILITGRASNTYRLRDATLWIGNAPYTELQTTSTSQATLAGSGSEQVFDIDPTITGRYVAIKGNAAECIHLRDVKVFGTGQAQPIVDSEMTLYLPAPSIVGDLVGEVSAIDLQGDTLEYHITDQDSNFTIDANGRITVAQIPPHNEQQEYLINVVVSDGFNEATTAVTVKLLGSNGVTFNKWNDISGSSLNDYFLSPRFGSIPDETQTLPAIDYQDNVQNNFAAQLITMVRPTVSGEYKFFVAADDASAINLSSSEKAADATRIVSRNGWTSYKNWSDSYASASISLQAGKLYYLEAIFKEGGGGEHITAAWTTPASSTKTLIPHENLFLGTLNADDVKPVFQAHDAEKLIPFSTEVGTELLTLLANDGQRDPLTYDLSGSSAFDIDDTGTITVATMLNSGTPYVLEVSASDGVHQTLTTITFNTTTMTVVEDALQSGESTAITLQEIASAMDTQIASEESSFNQATNTLYGLEEDGSSGANTVAGIDWRPTHDAVMFESTSFGGNFPLLISNHSYRHATAEPQRLPFGMGGISTDEAKFILLGANPMHDLASPSNRSGTANDGMQSWLERSIAWLTDRDDLDTANFKVTIAHLPDTYWFKNDSTTRNWFTETYANVSVNAPDACESDLLASCLPDTDLLVIGRDDGTEDNHNVEYNQRAILASVAYAQANGIPVLYVHYDDQSNDLSRALLGYFGVNAISNGWYRDEIVQGSAADLANVEVTSQAQLARAIAALDTGVAFTYVEELCPNGIGTLNCKTDQLLDETGASMNDVLFDGMNAARYAIRSFDRRGASVFDEDDRYRYLKLAVLLADKYRNDIRFPMDRLRSDQTEFFRAMFADYLVHMGRATNEYQPDVGRYTDAQIELNQAATMTATRSHTPTIHREWTSTGLYAPPGKPVTLTRTDTEDYEIRVQFNFMRNSTRKWNTWGYNRPLFVSSNYVTLNAGDTVTVSHPWGGPIFVQWEEVVENPEAFSLTLEGVLDNPLLDKYDAPSINAFSAEVEVTHSDWVDIRTDYAEIHSLKSNMVSVLDGIDGNSENGYVAADVVEYANEINTYLIAGNYGYAGYTGPGLPDHTAEVSAFCDATGLSTATYNSQQANLCTDEIIHRVPKKQHINSDISALCGSLCAGNPFDSGSGIQALGWGENHEMGHNLQRNRLKIYRGRSSEVSNNIFPYYTRATYYGAKGLANSSGGAFLGNAYAQVQESVSTGSSPSIEHPIWAGSGTYDNGATRLAFYLQLAYTQQSWDLFTKMYLQERVLTAAVNSDARWDEVKGLIGFSQYTRTEANNLTGEDFMYVTASTIGNKDYADWFAAWGVAVSDKAKAQVVANGITDTQPMIMYYSELARPTAILTVTLPMDGVTTWGPPAE